MKLPKRYLLLFAVLPLLVAQTKDGTSPRMDYTGTIAAITALNCSTGQRAFATNATAGQNIYLCTAANTWTQLAGSGGVSIYTNGTNVPPTRSTLNFISSTCITNTISDNSMTARTDIQQGVDTAICPTKANIQTGATTTLTETSSSSSVYTFTASPTMTVLPSGVGQLPQFTWKVGTTCSGGAITGNIDTLGVKSIVEPDGTNPTAAHCTAGQHLVLTYDSVLTKFVIVGGEAAGGGSLTPLTVGGFWPFGALSDSARTTTFPVGSNNRVQCSEFIAPYPGVTVAKVFTFVSTGTGTMAVGFYDAAGSLLTNGGSGTAAAPGAAATVFTFSPAVTLSAGTLYSACYTSTLSADAFYGSATGYSTDVVNNGESAGNLHIYYCANTSTAGAFPSTCSTRTNPGTASTAGLPAWFISGN